MRNFNLGDIDMSGATGMDALFERPKAPPKTASKIRVASVQQLQGFQRISKETLIHKSDRDLWGIRKEGDEYLIERLFDDAGNPIKG